MNEIKKMYFVFPVTLGFLLIISNLLNANLFVNFDYTFTVWFIFLLASFAIGWLMGKGFKRNKGVKNISIVIVLSIIISLVLVALFRSSFDMNNTLLGNFVLYSLRIFVLGSSAIFGLSISMNEKGENVAEVKSRIDTTPDVDLAKKEEYYIKEAKLKAEKILFEAKKEAQQIRDSKAQMERELRELIHTEREVIRSYEKEETSNDNEVE